MMLLRKSYHLLVPTVEVTLLALKAPSVLVEGGREWPCHLGWRREVSVCVSGLRLRMGYCNA